MGTDIGMVSDEIAIEVAEYGYEVHALRLSEYLAEEAAEDFRDKMFDERVWAAMDAGNELRAAWGRSDALALHAISDIVATREQLSPSHDDDAQAGYLERHAFILRSLKTPDELETLRAVYGPRLIVIAAYSPEEQRLEHLATQIARSRGTKDRTRWIHQPEDLIDREREGGTGRRPRRQRDVPSR